MKNDPSLFSDAAGEPERPGPRTSLTETVYARLRADLLACRFSPGDKLGISDLTASMGVSPPAVREALSRLVAEGLVTASPQKGFRVTPISEPELLDLTSVSQLLDGICLKRSIELGDVGWESRLVAAYHELSRTPERDSRDASRLSEAWANAHGRFHYALVSSCNSEWLLRLRNIIYAQTERYRRLSLPMSRKQRNVDKEHMQIMQAALDRDADRAVELIERHMAVTTANLLNRKTVNRTKTVRAKDRESAPT